MTAGNSQCVKRSFRLMAQKLCSSEENNFPFLTGFLYVCACKSYGLCTKYILEVSLSHSFSVYASLIF